MDNVTLCYGEDSFMTVTTEMSPGETRNGAAKRLRERIHRNQNKQHKGSRSETRRSD